MDEDTTTTTPTDVSVWEDVVSLDQILTRLIGTDLAPLPTDDVDGVQVAFEKIVRKFPLFQQALVRQVRDRGLHTDRGAGSVESYLRDVLRIDHSDARARVAAVEALHPRVQPTGEVLPAKYPVAAAAVAGGEISTAHALVIADSIDALPAAVTPHERVDAEHQMVENAQQMHPAYLKKVGEGLQAVLNPDGYLDTERERKDRRGMRLGKHLHGMHKAVLDLDPESANELMLYVEPLAKPEPQADGTPDPRTASQRRLDALFQLVRWGSEHPTMTKPGGRPVHVMATVTLKELYGMAGLAYLNNGDPLSVQELLAKAGQTDVSLTIFGTEGEVLHHGRTQRTAPAGLRAAVIARDRGCRHAGCDSKPLYCDVHHVTWWSRGGSTDIDNSALYCGRHHRLIHKEHWRAVMINGIPHSIPPPWIDPDQKPRRNRVHDPPR